jgi:hypothetical protein
LSSLRFTLLSDGSSDRALILPLVWLLQQSGILRGVQPQWADLRRLVRPARTLPERVRWAADLYPCEILFVHRDAESRSVQERRDEIRQALEPLGAGRPPAVCVVPVRMTEAWFLFDAQAIRGAAGNPRGGIDLELPRLPHCESLLDPKAVLDDLLARASELSGRRLRRFRSGSLLHRVSELISDFSPLRELQAFRELEQSINQLVNAKQWNR